LEENGPEAYNQIFNERQYNRRNGPGCVADYFRQQSGGRFNLQFDIFGPVKVSAVAMSGDGEDRNYGEKIFAEAMQNLANEHPELDCSPYDWDNDGKIDQVIIVYAGYTGNQVGFESYIWPNTWSMPEVTMPDGIKAKEYSASAELWTGRISCGIGLICHEFSHCLGLPDVYPTVEKKWTSSVVDEWDLMDGGTISNYGWCPPNYSPLEKIYLGWLEPIELTKDTIITGMKPVSEGGDVYMIKHTNNEYYLLENRTKQGWDAALPGQGLLVWHVNFDSYWWQANIINNEEGKPRYHLVTADNMDYDAWVDLYDSRGGGNPYQNKSMMNSYYLSSAAYPWATDSTDYVNRELTNSSVPATIMYNKNAVGSELLSKPITDITAHEDGTISFVFHASTSDGLITPSAINHQPSAIYTLTGRKIQPDAINSLPKGIYIIDGKKNIIK
jgi:M6 family metalloprotease-like protein